MGRPPDPKNRAALLQRIIDNLAQTGLGSLSLRSLAKDLGVTPPTLLHHFGSKEGMISEVLNTLEREQMGPVEILDQDGATLEDFVLRLWEIQSEEAELARVRLQLEAITIAATDVGLPGPVRAKIMEAWVKYIARSLERQGYERKEALAHASLIHSAITGLLLDLIATGDKERTGSAAIELGRLARSLDRGKMAPDTTGPAHGPAGRPKA
ncbi:TetR/AcrR family transcriptional regulator [Mesorhizobium sp. PAMC28654]|uniref:TetR/AcrR family transcriptional regulator n=1 Tax=Mesorhizobium sp. PAMC28654 TaxID=2880934 RepID=UPI001D0BA50D|nr:TetR/AcrR family transcriptional regulator [Mesorhizobium sp. PAMC28654]UDL88950.1 TetR/AcrR family transcriptional regulator [Mesorhizobium sp. PAMC28654]